MTDLSAEEWASIRSLGHLVRYPSGSYLGHEGAQDRRVFAIESGEVHIVLASEDGGRYLVGRRDAGDLVGEMAAIDCLPRSASMVAKGPVVAYRVSPGSFLVFLENHPAASLRIMQSMSRRLRQAAKMHVLRGGSLSCRVATTLLGLASDSTSGELELTQQELAEWVGATREATGRVLSDLREAKLLETGRGRIQILDDTGLAELCRPTKA